jgi:hypothetical protein
MAIGHALMANPSAPSMRAFTYQCIPYPKWCAKYFSIKTHKHEILKKVECRPIKHQLHFILLKAWTSFTFTRVAKLVTEQLVSWRSANFWKMLLWISCSKRKCWIVWKRWKNESNMTLQSGGDKMVETKTTENLEDYYRTLKKSLWKLLYCFYGSKIICRS